MKATIKDVARYAGVSVATVSRYLNKSPLIAEASVEKVRGAIEALDYQHDGSRASARKQQDRGSRRGLQ